MGDKATRGINRGLRITVRIHRRSNRWGKRTPSAIPRARSKLLEQVPEVRTGGRAMPFGVAFHPAAAAGHGSAPTSRFRCPFCTARMWPRSGQPRRSGQHPLPFGVRAEGPPVTALHAPVGSRPPRTVQLGGCDVQDRDGVGMRPPMPGTRRRRSSHRPTALRQAMSDRPGTSGLAARPSNTARGARQRPGQGLPQQLWER